MVRIKFLSWSLAFAVLASFLVCAGGNARADEKPKPPKKEETSDDETAKEIKKKLTEKRNTLRDAVNLHLKLINAGAGNVGSQSRECLDLARDLHRAELDLADKPSERIAACKEYFDTAKKLEDIFKKRVEAGTGGDISLLIAKAARLEAEIALLREQEKDKPKK